MTRPRALPPAATLLVVVVALLGACRGPIASLFPPAPGEGRPVYVVQHGWHTRVAVRVADVDPAQWPESRDFGDADYIEVGWGDAEFYQAHNGTVGQALRAAFTPTPAVLHAGAVDGPPERTFAGQEVVRVDVTPRGHERLVRHVAATYARDAGGRAARLRPGRYPRSAFYQATGTYHLLGNSNHWTARALRAAGAPVTPAYALTASNVIAQARRAQDAGR